VRLFYVFSHACGDALEWTVEHLFPPMIALGILAVVCALAWLAFDSLRERSKPECIAWHYEQRHVPAYTSFVLVGKVTVPMHHPAADVSVKVCDQRAAE
jgi:hypothetical protein